MRLDPRVGGLPLLVRIRRWTIAFIVLFTLSGGLAIPISMGIEAAQVRDPYMLYGTDWLAFGHFMFALVFVGAARDPVRNRWLYQFGMIAAAFVPLWALVFGRMRGIPMQWQLVDVALGVIGFIPMWLCNRWSRALELRGRRVSDP
jgi:hypothetical protein